ncbi:MAG: electron transfer flavoprotein subunit alpha/FixB family protein [Gemmatimonadota bacterium]
MTGRVLAYAEMREGVLRGVARETVSAARRLADELGGEVDVLALGGSGAAETVAELAGYGGDRLFVAEDESFRHYHPEASVRAIEELAGRESYAALLFPASAQGKDLAPRAAARLDRGLATEVTEIRVEDGELVVTRPQFAGKAYARLRFTETPALISLRPNVFLPERRDGGGAIERLEVASSPSRVRVKGIERGERDALDVSEATVVVSGGRGMRDPSNWHILEDLVDALGPGAALGASRAVVDAGWRPHSEQVGQTGKVVSPNLYFAVGISGAIQHLAGIRTAKVVVAINKDREAPIFDIADYGVVGDLFEIVPRLAEEVRQLRESRV